MSGNDKFSNFRNHCGDFFVVADVIKKFIDKEFNGEELNTSNEFNRHQQIHYNGQILEFALSKKDSRIIFEIISISE